MKPYLYVTLNKVRIITIIKLHYIKEINTSAKSILIKIKELIQILKCPIEET